MTLTWTPSTSSITSYRSALDVRDCFPDLRIAVASVFKRATVSSTVWSPFNSFGFKWPLFSNFKSVKESSEVGDSYTNSSPSISKDSALLIPCFWTCGCTNPATKLLTSKDCVSCQKVEYGKKIRTLLEVNFQNIQLLSD